MPRINFMLKIQDARMTEVKKALEKANIKVISIYEVFKEKPPKKPAPPPDATPEVAPAGGDNGGST